MKFLYGKIIADTNYSQCVFYFYEPILAGSVRNVHPGHTRALNDQIFPSFSFSNLGIASLFFM